MGHSHGHDSHYSHEEMQRIHELMYEDHQAVFAKVEGAVAKAASPVWRILAVFGIHHGQY